MLKITLKFSRRIMGILRSPNLLVSHCDQQIFHIEQSKFLEVLNCSLLRLFTVDIQRALERNKMKQQRGANFSA